MGFWEKWFADLEIDDSVYYRVQNHRKIAQAAANPGLVNDPNLAFLDLTDQQNPAFRYAL